MHFRQRGPWRRAGRDRAFPWGYMTPENNFTARAYYPPPLARAALGRGRIPYWHIVDFTLAARASGDDEFLPTGNFVGLTMMGNSTQGPKSYQLQFFQILTARGQKGRPFSRIPVIERAAVGTGALPMIFRELLPLPDLLSVLVRIQNRTAAANTVQVALFGLQQKEG